MFSLKNLLFLATTVSALVIQERTPATILNDLKTIDTNTKNLNTQIKSWDGTTLGAQGINSAESTLDKSIKAGTTDASKEPVASSADSKSIIGYVTGTLEPDVKATLATLKSRKADFAKASLTDQVKSDLNTLKTDSDALANALIKAASADQQTNAKNAKATLDADFNDAITFFAS